MRIRCPHCRATFMLPHDVADGPTPEDVIVCAFCVATLIFDDALSLRVAGPADFQQMSAELRLATEYTIQHTRAQNQIKQTRLARHFVN